MVAATDGAGPLPIRAIEAALAQGWVVSCAFDNHQTGDKRWREVRELYPTAGTIVRDVPPTPGKDWNDALRASASHEREQSQQHEHGRSPDRERGRDARLEPERDTRADQRR